MVTDSIVKDLIYFQKSSLILLINIIRRETVFFLDNLVKMTKKIHPQNGSHSVLLCSEGRRDIIPFHFVDFLSFENCKLKHHNTAAVH